MARPREVTDEEILSTARQVFLEQGPSVSTSVIAKALGVSSATLFHRFGSKSELMLTSLLPPPPPVELLKFNPEVGLKEQLAPLARLLQAYPGHDDRIRCLMQAGFQPSDVFKRYDKPPPVMMLEALTAFFQQAQDAGAVPQATARHQALAFMGSIKANHFFKHVVQHSALDDEDAYVNDLLDMLLGGLS